MAATTKSATLGQIKKGRSIASKPRRNLDQPDLRKRVVYADPHRWDKDIHTGDSTN
ncbi:MAG: hypothetical protein LH606_02865 [Cytophagaceae bacterium]|nr:hypothetical protein [Cytophagaceae bacterium]